MVSGRAPGRHAQLPLRSLSAARERVGWFALRRSREGGVVTVEGSSTCAGIDLVPTHAACSSWEFLIVAGDPVVTLVVELHLLTRLHCCLVPHYRTNEDVG